MVQSDVLGGVVGSAPVRRGRWPKAQLVRIRGFAAAAAATLMETAVLAQDRCPTFTGQIIAPVTVESVITRVSTVPSIKGEYETTAAFETRRNAAASALPEEFLVSIPLDPQYLRYNADAGSLSVGAYAIDNRNTTYDGAFGPGTSHPNVRASPFNNLDLLASETETPTGSYGASNAFGATTVVTEIQRSSKAIFERALEPGETTFANVGPDLRLIDIPMSPEEARRFRTSGRAAAVIRPQAPFFAVARRRWSPRFDRPTDISQSVQIVVADIQCVLLTDSASRVVGAVSVR